MKEAKVSVIIPVYNGEQYIENTLDSILQQSYTNIEVILVNDGSKDASLALLHRLAQRDDRIVVLDKANGGVADARNYGITHCTGAYVAFCDQDDLWYQDKLTQQMPLFSKASIGLVHGGSENFYTATNKTYQPNFKRKHRGKIFSSLIEENQISCCSAVARTDLIKQVGMFDPDPALMGVDDWHLWLKLALVSEVDFVETVVAKHIFHGDNYSMLDEKMHHAEIVCLEKNKSRICSAHS